MDDEALSLPESLHDLTDAQIKAAIGSSEEFEIFLKFLAGLAEPEKGAPKILRAIARMASSDCSWLDGELRVEIDGNEQSTTIAVLSELGGGFREAVFPRLKLAVPLDEFTRAVRVAPKMYAPMVTAPHATRLVLVASAEHVSVAPLPVPEIAAPKSRPSLLPPTVRKPPLIIEAPTITMAAVRPSARPTKPPTEEARAASAAEAADEAPPSEAKPPKKREQPSMRPTMPEIRLELPPEAFAPGAVTPTSPTLRKIPGWEHARPTVRKMPAIRPKKP